VGEDRTPPEQRRYTVSEAAELLGISAEAVRTRVRRGKLPSERREGTVYVVLDADQTARVSDRTDDRTADLINTLREQLEAEREANRENRRIIAMLASRVPELEAPSEPSEGSQTATEEADRGRVAPQPEAGTDRPWWRRIFG
jgi:excisionase family DNA binding protein